jgi:hypothetical protein
MRLASLDTDGKLEFRGWKNCGRQHTAIGLFSVWKIHYSLLRSERYHEIFIAAFQKGIFRQFGLGQLLWTMKCISSTPVQTFRAYTYVLYVYIYTIYIYIYQYNSHKSGHPSSCVLFKITNFGDWIVFVFGCNLPSWAQYVVDK